MAKPSDLKLPREHKRLVAKHIGEDFRSVATVQTQQTLEPGPGEVRYFVLRSKALQMFAYISQTFAYISPFLEVVTSRACKLRRQ